MVILPAKSTLLPAIKCPVTTHDVSSCYVFELDGRCQDFITRYLGQSLTTPDDPNMAQVNSGLLDLAFTVSTTPRTPICYWKPLDTNLTNILASLPDAHLSCRRVYL